MNKKPSAKDPTQFFLNQNLAIPEPKKKLAHEFSRRLLNNDKCPICNLDYDLNEHTPKILIQCGHTFCITCLEMFFKNYLIRCPMCLKLLKRVKVKYSLNNQKNLIKKRLLMYYRLTIRSMLG